MDDPLDTLESLGSHLLDFLLPVFPVLFILEASVVDSTLDRLKFTFGAAELLLAETTFFFFVFNADLSFLDFVFLLVDTEDADLVLVFVFNTFLRRFVILDTGDPIVWKCSYVQSQNVYDSFNLISYALTLSI